MKVNFNRVGAGAAALLLSAGFLISGGCSSSKVLEQRPYIPAPSGDDVAAAPADLQAAPATGGEVKPAAVETAPPAFQPSSSPSQYAPPPYHHKSSASSYHGEGQVYTIQKGDSLWKIGHKFGVSTKDLAAYNNIPESKMLVVGKTLRIPAGGHKMKSASTSPSTKKKATAATMASSKPTKSSKPAAKAEKAEKSEKSGNGGTYVVQKGDSFWKIARKLKVTTADLAAANNKKPSDMLQVGQKLVVPGKSEGKSKTSTAKTEKAGKAESSEKKETDDMIKDLDVTSSADTAKTSEKAVVKTSETVEKAEKVGGETTTKAVDTAAPVKAEKAADVTDLESTKSRNVEVTEDTTIEQFAAKNGVKVDEVKKLNPEIGADGKLTKGNIITIPE